MFNCVDLLYFLPGIRTVGNNLRLYSLSGLLKLRAIQIPQWWMPIATAEKNTFDKTPHTRDANGKNCGHLSHGSSLSIPYTDYYRHWCTCHSTSGSTSRRVFLVQTEQEFMNEDGIDSDQKLEPLKFRLGEVKIIDVPKFIWFSRDEVLYEVFQSWYPMSFHEFLHT